MFLFLAPAYRSTMFGQAVSRCIMCHGRLNMPVGRINMVAIPRRYVSVSEKYGISLLSLYNSAQSALLICSIGYKINLCSYKCKPIKVLLFCNSFVVENLKQQQKYLCLHVILGYMGKPKNRLEKLAGFVMVGGPFIWFFFANPIDSKIIYNSKVRHEKFMSVVGLTSISHGITFLVKFFVHMLLFESHAA